MSYLHFPPLPVTVGGPDRKTRNGVRECSNELIKAMERYEEDLSARGDVLDRVMDLYFQLGAVLDAEYSDDEIFDAYVSMRGRMKGL